MFYAAVVAFVSGVLLVSFVIARRWKREDRELEQKKLEAAFRRGEAACRTWQDIAEEKRGPG